MRKFKGNEFVEQLNEFLDILEKENFKEYLLIKINFKKPKHSDIDILSTNCKKLVEILNNKNYKEGYDLRYYKKDKIPIDVHNKIKWNIIQFNTKRLMRRRIIRKFGGHAFYYLSHWDNHIINFVHYFYTKAVEIKWRIGRKLGLKKYRK